MKQKTTQCMPGARGLCAALAITALAAIGSPGTASASTTAGATILNVVEVDYKDATGLGTVYTAAFSTSVSVNLVKAGLSITTPPNSAAIPGFLCADEGSYASGDHFIAYYAMTATANGQDTYKLSLTNQIRHFASSETTLYSLLNPYDASQAAAPTSAATTRILNSAIVVGTSGSDTLLFPGGSLKTNGTNGPANGGLAPNDVVVVDFGGVKTAFLVKAVTLGNAATFPNNGATPATTGNATQIVPEVQDKVQVQAFLNDSLGFGSGAAGVAPDFTHTAPAIGTVVGQMMLVKIDITAITNTIGSGNDAYVDYTLTTTDSATGNPQYVGSGGSNICDGGYFLTTQLSIVKAVRNVTRGDASFLPATTSNPGDVLEYQVTVNNPGGQATLSSVADNIPPYTKLVTYTGVYGTGATFGTTAGNFATISDGVNAVNLKADGTTSAQPASPAPIVGYGTAAGFTASSLLKFNLGQGSSSSVGGTVPSCSDLTKNTVLQCTSPTYSWRGTYTIKYAVQVD